MCRSVRDRRRSDSRPQAQPSVLTSNYSVAGGGGGGKHASDRVLLEITNQHVATMIKCARAYSSESRSPSLPEIQHRLSRIRTARTAYLAQNTQSVCVPCSRHTWCETQSVRVPCSRTRSRKNSSHTHHTRNLVPERETTSRERTPTNVIVTLVHVTNEIIFFLGRGGGGGACVFMCMCLANINKKKSCTFCVSSMETKDVKVSQDIAFDVKTSVGKPTEEHVEFFRLLQCDIPQKTLWAGTTLTHQRMETRFPVSAGSRPTFLYNWFTTDRTRPFWNGNSDLVATYRYRTVGDIHTLIDTSRIGEEALRLLFTEMWPAYVSRADECNDYALAAFATQVLGFAGIYDSRTGSVILDNHIYLEWISTYCPHHMPCHPGYVSSTMPDGYGAPPSSMIGCVAYSQHDTALIHTTSTIGHFI
jgi:hypothetical protein